MKRYHNARRVRRAFTLIELLCTVAIIAIVLALLMPVLQGAFGHARRTVCSNNLENMGIAFNSWAHDHNDLFPMQVSISQGGTREFAEAAAANPNVSSTFRHFKVLSNELALAKILRCPADRQRTPAENFAALDNTNVSYFINVGAAFGRTDSPIAGDRNVRTSGRTEWTFVQFGASNAVEFTAELHGNRGNVLFGDGHISLLDGSKLAYAFGGGAGIVDTTLSLPRPTAEEVAAFAANNSASDADTQGSRSSAQETGGASQGAGSKSGQAETQTRGNSNTVARPQATVPGRSFSGGSRAVGSEEMVVVTRLDGTVATQSVPRKVSAPPAAPGFTPGEVNAPVNPFIEFVDWLARKAAKHTYWLLLLLLAALIAFEISRRHSGRKQRRGPSSE
jgi:prepilin-type N-terminal cleavage/methylation domain-containing protein/prepilin-type processing-associated H-X9-DG protein